MEPASQGQHREGEVGIDGIDGQEAHYGGLRGIVDEPREVWIQCQPTLAGKCNSEREKGIQEERVRSCAYIPSRHQTVGEEEGQIAAGEALEYPEKSSISFLYPKQSSCFPVFI